MKRNIQIISVIVIVIIVGGSAFGIEHYLNNSNASNSSKSTADTLTPVYNVNVTEANGTVESFNLSNVGGYAYIPSPQNGTWDLNHTLSRIVTLIPSVTATLYALHSYNDVIGVDQYSVYPAPTKNVTVFNFEIGSIPLESITNLTPGVVVDTSGTFSTQQLNQLVNVLHIPYLVIDPGTISQIENQTTLLGYLTGTSNNANIINSWMNYNIQNLSNDLSNISSSSEYSVFYYLYPASDGIYTAGPGTFINQELKDAHLNNIVNVTGYPVVSAATVANANPDYVLLDQYTNETTLNQTIQGLPAEKQNHIVQIANDDFFSEPNFRIVYSMYWLAEQFYPHNVNLSDVYSFNKYTGLNLSQQPGVGVNS